MMALSLPIMNVFIYSIFVLGICVTVLLRDQFAQFMRSFARAAGQEVDSNELTRLRTMVASPMAVLLYAYAWRLYLDFSGYTDIAIGLGRLFGVRLPENFERPYLKPNLTTFWNSWHITLAQWFRAYFFNQLTRALRSRPRPLPAALIILIGQVGTMLLIGLWHGVTWNFVAWGARSTARRSSSAQPAWPAWRSPFTTSRSAGCGSRFPVLTFRKPCSRDSLACRWQPVCPIRARIFGLPGMSSSRPCCCSSG